MYSLFLNPVFQSFLASAIYGTGVALVEVIGKNRAFEKRYKKAFERAVSQFYADPDMVGNEARRNYSDYLKMLQDESKKEDILATNNHVYEELSELFAQEVSRDKWLLGYTMLKGKLTSEKKLAEIQNGIDKLISEIKVKGKESHEEHKEISEKLDYIKKLITNPEMQAITLTTLHGGEVAQPGEQSHTIGREKLVDQCIQVIESGKLLILHGALRVGKSTLAELIMKKRPSVNVLDNVLSSNLEYLVRCLLTDNSEGIGMIVTSAPLNANLNTLDFSGIEQIEVPLLTVTEVGELVGTYHPAFDCNAFIAGFSGGHPVLVRTLCSYLSSIGWKVNENNFSSLLNYSFDTDLIRSLSDLMGKIIKDKDTRSLFNRLLLVIGDFNEETVCKLANISPQIDEPRKRLYDLMPSWVSGDNGVFKVNPLFGKAWMADVADDCKKACYKVLADSILHLKHSMGEAEVMGFLTYAIKADEYDEAGMMLIMVLSKLHDAQVKVPKGSLLRAVWIDIALPVEMSIDVRIGVRIAQLLLIDDLSQAKRQYLLWDLKQLVQANHESKFRAFFYSTVTMLCWQEEDVADGLKFYEEYKALSKDGTQDFVSKFEGSMQLFDTNIWFFLLQLSTEDKYLSWLETFRLSQIEYAHDDRMICEHCYLSITRFVVYYLKDATFDSRLEALTHIKNKADKSNCPELAITCLAQIMDLYTSGGCYSEAQTLHLQEYDKYKEYPMAQILLNGAMANSFYRSGDKGDDTFKYYESVIGSNYTDLVPNVQLHLKQLYAYVIAQTDVKRCIALLEEALMYAEDEGHRVSVFEYYQCYGELSYAYWCDGQKEKAIEALSSCVSFVLPQAENGRRFAKTYLCLCNCLLNYISRNIKGSDLPSDQAVPHHGMFTENDLQGLDDLYTEDRQYVTCYQMSDVCNSLMMKDLSYEWACKSIEACKKRGEARETHYMLFLLLPLFIVRNEYNAIKYINEHSVKARYLTYQRHPGVVKGNIDQDFVEFQIVPSLMGALVSELRGEEMGLEMIKEVLAGYTAADDEECMKMVRDAFERDAYDRNYIAEINKLDINKRYTVYICAYLITAVHSDADYAFSLLISVLPKLEEQLVRVMGHGVVNVINYFVTSFWKTKIIQHPEEFRDSTFLQEKGMKLIDNFKGKDNQANHTMLVVSNHLRREIKLNQIQEDWLDA